MTARPRPAPARRGRGAPTKKEPMTTDTDPGYTARFLAWLDRILTPKENRDA